MPISYGTTTSAAASNTIHYIKIPRYDSTYDYQVSVAVKTLGGSAGTSNGYTLSNHSSPELVSAGWTYKGGINGGLFYTTGAPQYAIGMEVVNWTPWYSGTSQDSHDGTGIISIWGANDVDMSLDQSGDTNGEMYAITSAGCFIRGGADYNGKANAVVSQLSGRSFVAKTANNIYLIATAGDTGSAGVQGYTNMRTVVRKVATAAGDSAILEAVVLDGGGSVGLRYGTTNYISSSRSLKNAILVYEKSKTVVPDPGPTPTPDPTPVVADTSSAGIPPTIFAKAPKRKKLYVKQNNTLVEIKQINVKDSELVSIIKDWVEKE